MIKGLIVSCQANEGEILHDYNIMGAMAVAAKAGGAKAIRCSGIRDIKEIKKAVDLPILGIIKAHYDDSSIIITPTLKEIKELCEEGVDCIALDATLRKRPNDEKLEDLVKYVKNNYPNIKLMADTAQVSEAINAEKIGFDIVSTTLCGYTEDTKGIEIPNIEIIKEYLRSVKIPVIVEGGVWEVGQLQKILELGVETVVIGTAITRPKEITERFNKCFNK